MKTITILSTLDYHDIIVCPILDDRPATLPRPRKRIERLHS
jgi:hypothetical protein